METKTPQLIHEINGIKYLLMEIMVTKNTTANKMEAACKKYNCILQGVKEVNLGSFWKDAYAVVRVLVPENKIFEFQDAI
jgi:hypothetical protein